jgi:hypothetical protein
MVAHKKYNADDLESVADKLKNMPAVEKKDTEVSKSEAIKMLLSEIILMQERGYSLEQIADTLTDNGVDIKTPTLKSYLQRHKSNLKAGSETKKKAPASTKKKTVKEAKKKTGKDATFTTKPDREDI